LLHRSSPSRAHPVERLEALTKLLPPNFLAGRSHANLPQGVHLGHQARATNRFDGTLWNFVDGFAKRFGSKVEIVDLLEVHPEIGT
jgi:hypothetical protein